MQGSFDESLKKYMSFYQILIEHDFTPIDKMKLN